ncbi:MAG: hypothetical protein IJC09_04135, partial [Clostridia bacterium]|nr:hypothetical protein [Clostridia bacterium]
MKKVFSVLIALAMLISTAVVPMSVSADESVWGGSTDIDSTWEGEGTEESPYLITSAAELAGLAKTVYDAISTTSGAVDTGTTGMSNMYSGTYFKLTTDINLNNKEWTPIGRFGMRFNGNFDGNGHIVKNLNITTTHYAMGLFGATGTNSSISDIGVENVNIVWKNGSAADYNASGDATLHPNNRNRGEAAGGLIGIAGGGTVSESYVRTVTINGSGNAVEYGVGGLIGFCYGTETTKNTVTVTNCYAVNLNLTTNRLVSAFIGASSRDTTAAGCNIVLTNCYTGGTVSMDCGTSGTVTNFLSGKYANETITNCYTIVSADVITTGESSFATVSD